MSHSARDWVWGSCRGLTPAVRSLLLALAEHADEGGRCWPSLSRLSRVTELDRRTVTRGLEELEARAFLTRERRPGESTCYRLLLDRPRPGGERRSSPIPGTTLRDQGRATPGGVTPPGARGPRSRGVAPLARGETPPDVGASDPPNRHKNRHGTVSEPSMCDGDGPDTRTDAQIPSGKACRIPPDWQPSARVFAWAQQRGLPRAWVEAQLEEFRLYWGDTGERRKSWDATFINRLQLLQSRQPKDPPHEPEQRLADKDYAAGATPPEQIPWLKRTIAG